MSNKKRLALALKFAVSGVLIWYLLRYKVDLEAAKARLLEVEIDMVLLAAAILLVQAVICVMRWGAVLEAIRAPLGFVKALKFFLIGAFFNQALPSSVGGDAVRVYKAYHGGLSLSGAVNGVMLERAATVVVIVPLVAALMPVFLTRVDDQAGRLDPFHPRPLRRGDGRRPGPAHGPRPPAGKAHGLAAGQGPELPCHRHAAPFPGPPARRQGPWLGGHRPRQRGAGDPRASPRPRHRCHLDRLSGPYAVGAAGHHGARFHWRLGRARRRHGVCPLA